MVSWVCWLLFVVPFTPLSHTLFPPPLKQDSWALPNVWLWVSASVSISCWREPFWWRLIMLGSFLQVLQNIIKNPLFFFFFPFCWVCLVLPKASGLSSLWFLALQTVRHGLISWYGPHAGPVIDWPLPQFLCHLFSGTSCGQVVCWRLCGWVGVPVAPLEDLPGYGKWLIQALYPLLRGVLARVILIHSLEFPFT